MKKRKEKKILYEIPAEQAESYLETACEHAAATARRIVNSMPLETRWDFCARCIEAWLQSEALAAVAKKNRDNKTIRTLNRDLADFLHNTLRSCGITITITNQKPQTTP